MNFTENVLRSQSQLANIPFHIISPMLFSPIDFLIFLCYITLKLTNAEEFMSPTKNTQITLPNGEIIPVVSAEFAKETAETVRLRTSAAKAGANAVANALAKGIPVTIMRDGALIQINPDRTETVIEVLS